MPRGGKRPGAGRPRGSKSKAKPKAATTRQAVPAASSPPVKRRPGRPSTYDPAICEEVIAMGAEGASKAEIALQLGISPTNSFYRWQDEHPEFREAVKEAERLSQGWWEGEGRKAVFNSIGFSATAYIFQMKNRFRRDWGDTSADAAIRELHLHKHEHLHISAREKIERELEKIEARAAAPERIETEEAA